MPGYEVYPPEGGFELLSGTFQMARNLKDEHIPVIVRENGKVHGVHPLARIDSDGKVIYRPQAHLLKAEDRAWLLANPEWVNVPPLPPRKKSGVHIDPHVPEWVKKLECAQCGEPLSDCEIHADADPQPFVIAKCPEGHSRTEFWPAGGKRLAELWQSRRG